MTYNCEKYVITDAIFPYYDEKGWIYDEKTNTYVFYVKTEGDGVDADISMKIFAILFGRYKPQLSEVVFCFDLPKLNSYCEHLLNHYTTVQLSDHSLKLCSLFGEQKTFHQLGTYERRKKLYNWIINSSRSHVYIRDRGMMPQLLIGPIRSFFYYPRIIDARFDTFVDFEDKADAEFFSGIFTPNFSLELIIS